MNESKVLLSMVDELINHHENTIKTLNKLRSHLEDEKEVEQESSKEEKSYSKEDVRAILSEKSAAGFGTGDCVIVSDDILQIIDYKHGLGVFVEAKDNSQMMCYALGALETFDGIYDIHEIQMTIFQPRRSNVSPHTISKEELLNWANNTLAPIAKLAYEGKGDFKAGSHCQFCKAKAICRKRAEYNRACKV